MALKIFRSTSLPLSPAERHKNCMYLVKPEGSTVIDLYVVDANGNAFSNFNEPRFAGLFEKYARSLQTFNIAANIAERDALELAQNTLIFVLDATQDPSVPSGSALYFFMKESGVYVKVFQSVGVDWDYIHGKPTSTAEQIDQAVISSHNHENMTVLNAIDATGDVLFYKDTPVTKYLVGSSDW